MKKILVLLILLIFSFPLTKDDYNNYIDIIINNTNITLYNIPILLNFSSNIYFEETLDSGKDILFYDSNNKKDYII